MLLPSMLLLYFVVAAVIIVVIELLFFLLLLLQLLLLLVSCYTHTNNNVVVVVVVVVAAFAFVVGLYYVRYLLQCTLVAVVTDVYAAVFVNTNIVVCAYVAAVTVILFLSPVVEALLLFLLVSCYTHTNNYFHLNTGQCSF
jgi:hypothetical protein